MESITENSTSATPPMTATSFHTGSSKQRAMSQPNSCTYCQSTSHSSFRSSDLILFVRRICALTVWVIIEPLNVSQNQDAETVEENTTLLYATALLTMRDPPNKTLHQQLQGRSTSVIDSNNIH